jgi:tRNA dimethylallyltransferase
VGPLAVLGPTASGKSALALEVARLHQAAGRATELVAIDAFTVYRGMDIGTASPSPEERAAVRHHLVDVLDPWEELTVAGFQQLARRAIAEVEERGATALLVGGSGLYWRAVVDELSFPPTDPAVRAEVESRWGHDPHGAHDRLAELDPVAAERIAPENLRRTVRALEVIELTGSSFSGFDDAWGRYESRYPHLEVALLDPPTAWLRDRIHRRAVSMVAAGLLEEARALRELPLSRTAAQAIGYAEAFLVLDGRMPVAELADAIATRTWRYAKRQRGWFRADPRLVATDPAEVVARWC